MIAPIHAEKLRELGYQNNACILAEQINACLKKGSATAAWKQLSQTVLNADIPFNIHLYLFLHLYPHWKNDLSSAPAWVPSDEVIKNTHIFAAMKELHFATYEAFHAFSVQQPDAFWQYVLTQLNIIFKKLPKKIADFSQGVESPQWFSGGEINIVDSCLRGPTDKIALIFENEKGEQITLTYGMLTQWVNQIANSLVRAGFIPKDPIAIDMPMTHYAVAIYLAIIKMGGIVVSIADSFSKEEIATRLKITKAKAIFTQDFILRDNKKLPLYEKVTAANAPQAIVLPCQERLQLTLREEDLAWKDFLLEDVPFTSYSCSPMTACNILFSSGTTGEPKAIPWNHTTAIKAASDAYFHHDIHTDDILCWPTNLGWMMGPWLIFAGLINNATIALYEGSPRSRAFGEFVQNNKISFLGVVPTLVATWRQSQCMENLNWEAIKLFSSTGECSNPEDMLYLMSLAGYKPIIEYCGGTEIGGGYVTSTLVQNNYPSVFTTPALGLNFILLDENQQVASAGEVALIPPSVGLSTELLNADHQQIYYEKMPKIENIPLLRRHGDQLYQFPNGFYSVLGRADDTMNLGGIKISSIEIERTLAGIQGVIETAAVAHAKNGHGPSQLIIFAATSVPLDKMELKTEMQKKINQYLNPLFKIEDVILIKELPKTASNKIMRRTLRTMIQ